MSQNESESCPRVKIPDINEQSNEHIGRAAVYPLERGFDQTVRRLQQQMLHVQRLATLTAIDKLEYQSALAPDTFTTEQLGLQREQLRMITQDSIDIGASDGAFLHN